MDSVTAMIVSRQSPEFQTPWMEAVKAATRAKWKAAFRLGHDRLAYTYWLFYHIDHEWPGSPDFDVCTMPASPDRPPVCECGKPYKDGG